MYGHGDGRERTQPAAHGDLHEQHQRGFGPTGPSASASFSGDANNTAASNSVNFTIAPTAVDGYVKLPRQRGL